MKEIEIEGLGTMRLCNTWQINRINKMRPGPDRALASAAFGLGMTLRQFKQLPLDQQDHACQAYSQLAFEKNGGVRNFAQGAA